MGNISVLLQAKIVNKGSCIVLTLEYIWAEGVLVENFVGEREVLFDSPIFERV